MTEGLELIEMPPASLADLDELTDEARTMYEADESGRYRLKAVAKAAIEEVNAEISAAWTEHDKKMGDMDRKIEAQDAEIRRLACRRDIGNALAIAGVKTSYFNAAATLLEQNLDIEVTENSDGSVTTSAMGLYGRTSVGQAVAHWLASDEGQAFRPKVATHGEGQFQAAVRALKARLH